MVHAAASTPHRLLAIATIALVGAVVLALLLRPDHGPAARVPAVTPDAPTQPLPAVADAPPVDARRERTEVALPAVAADSATIRGRCVAAEDGRPLAGCEVHNQQPEIVVPTGADGRFELRVGTDTAPSLRITAADRSTRTATWRQPLGANAVEDLGDVRMPRGFRVRGRVVDDTGRGFADITVLVMGLETSVRPGITDFSAAGAQTAADGAFELDPPMAAGDWEAGLFAQQVQRDPFAFHVDPLLGCEPLTIVAARSASIDAHVVDEQGEAFAGATFAAENSGNIATSDANGDLRLWSNGPVTGETRILLQDLANADPAFEPPTVAWGSTGVRLLLHRGSAFPIAVVDDAGAPVEEFAVLLLREGTSGAPQIGRARHEGGRCAIPEAHPGTNTLRVLPTAPDLLASEPETVVITGRETAPLRVVLERLRACPVQVVYATGALVVGSRLELVRVGADRKAAETAMQDPRQQLFWNPQWRIAELLSSAVCDRNGCGQLFAPASMRGLLVHVTGRHLPVFVDEPALAPSAPLRIVVTASGELQGKVLLHGQPAELFGVALPDAQPAVRVDLQADGSFRMQPLAAGRLRVVATCQLQWKLLGNMRMSWAPLATTARDVEIRTGAVTEVELDPGTIRPATVRGRVRFDGDAAGAWLLSLCRTDCDARLGAFTIAADGSFVAEGVLPGSYRVAVSRRRMGQEALAQGRDEFDVPPGADVVHDVAFAVRRLVLHLRNPDGSPAASGLFGFAVRCGAVITYGHEHAGELVLDPAPELPVQVAANNDGPWSEPVSMPHDRREHTATVVVPAK